MEDPGTCSKANLDPPGDVVQGTIVDAENNVVQLHTGDPRRRVCLQIADDVALVAWELQRRRHRWRDGLQSGADRRPMNVAVFA